MIELRHVKKAFEQATPLEDVSATIHDGDVICVIGPSGTGKSTLLRCINLLSPPTSGEMLLEGEDICKMRPEQVRRRIGMVFQSFYLFAHLTVLENIVKPQMDVLKRGRQEACDVAMDLLRRVGLESRAFQYPDMLSGGQQQRVAIVRTLALEPKIILFDEPTSALDPLMTREVQGVILSLAAEGHTMMIVTHDMHFAREVSNRVFYMDEGGIYEDGSPEQIFESPQKEKTRAFIHNLQILSLESDKHSFDFIQATAKLEDYRVRTEIPGKLYYHLQAVFEELVAVSLLPRLSERTRISVYVEYSRERTECSLTIRYGGEPFDPLTAADEISAALIRSMTDSIGHAAETEGEYTNRITAVLR